MRTAFAALLFGLALFGAVGPVGAQAQSDPEGAILVIDRQKVLRESEAAMSLRDQAEAMRSDLSVELTEREAALREDERRFAEESPSLSEEERNERRAKLESQAVELQRLAQDGRRSADQAFAQGMRQIQTEIVKIVSEIAGEQGAAIVLPRSAVVIARPELDITDIALQRLNERLPSIDISSTGEAAGGSSEQQ